MMNTNLKETVLHGLGRMRRVWAGIMASLVFYIAAGHALGGGIGAPAFPVADEHLDYLRSIALVLGLVIVVALNQYRHRAFRRSLADRIEDRSTMRTYRKVVYLSLIGAEALAVIGFVLFMTGGQFKTLYGFTAGAAILMFFYRPKLHEWEYVYRALDGDGVDGTPGV